MVTAVDSRHLTEPVWGLCVTKSRRGPFLPFLALMGRGGRKNSSIVRGLTFDVHLSRGRLATMVQSSEVAGQKEQDDNNRQQVEELMSVTKSPHGPFPSLSLARMGRGRTKHNTGGPCFGARIFVVIFVTSAQSWDDRKVRGHESSQKTLPVKKLTAVVLVTRLLWQT